MSSKTTARSGFAGLPDAGARPRANGRRVAAVRPGAAVRPDGGALPIAGRRAAAVRPGALFPLAAAMALLFPAPSALAEDEPHLHDGFHLRLGLGIGRMSVQRDATRADTSTVGPASSFDVTAGSTVAPGLVVGGSLLSFSIAEATLEPDNGGAGIALDGPLGMALLGATLDWYPEPHRGGHVGLTLGLAAVVGDLPPDAPAQDYGIERIGGGGGGISLFSGYDWWVAPQWSLGALVRFTAVSVRGEAEANGVTLTENDSAWSLVGAFSAVYQ